jgi:hypothetical protein
MWDSKRLARRAGELEIFAAGDQQTASNCYTSRDGFWMLVTWWWLGGWSCWLTLMDDWPRMLDLGALGMNWFLPGSDQIRVFPYVLARMAWQSTWSNWTLSSGTLEKVGSSGKFVRVL